MLRGLARTFIIFGLYGFIPGFWLYGLPAVLAYGAIKLTLLIWRNGLVSLLDRVAEGMVHGAEHLLEKARQSAVAHPAFVLKGILSFFALFLVSMPWSFLALYALYRFSGREWLEVLQAKIEWGYDHFLHLFSFLTRDISFAQKMGVLFSLTAFIAAPLFYLIGVVGVIDLAFIAFTTLAVSIGLNVLLRDIKEAIRNPLRAFCAHSGKILGGLQGRTAAFLASPGTVVGSLGVAVGEVHSHGIFSNLFPSFLYPSGGKFIFDKGLGALFASRAGTFFNSIYTSIFFAHNMQLRGDFYGVIGPTSFQIFLFIGFGALLGYAAERIADQLVDTVIEDVRSTKDKIVSVVRRRRPAEVVNPPIVPHFQQQQQPPLVLPPPPPPADNQNEQGNENGSRMEL